MITRSVRSVYPLNAGLSPGKSATDPGAFGSWSGAPTGAQRDKNLPAEPASLPRYRCADNQ